MTASRFAKDGLTKPSHGKHGDMNQMSTADLYRKSWHTTADYKGILLELLKEAAQPRPLKKKPPTTVPLLTNNQASCIIEESAVNS